MQIQQHENNKYANKKQIAIQQGYHVELFRQLLN
jgi:hypothetical protein